MCLRRAQSYSRNMRPPQLRGLVRGVAHQKVGSDHQSLAQRSSSSDLISLADDHFTCSA